MLYFDSAEMMLMKLVGSSEFFTDAQDCCTLLAWKYVFLGVYANSRQKSDRATFVRKYCTRAGRAGFFYRISIEFCRVLLVEILLEPTWAHT